MAERVLCVVAHPDDETLLAGATLAKHAKAGDAVSVLVLADGVMARSGGGINPGLIKERHGMLRKACGILGTEDVWIRAYPDNQMDRGPLLQVVKDIEVHVERFKPTIVYTHWHGDLNVDHQVVSRAVLTACRPRPGGTVKRILMGECPSSTEWGAGFTPNWFEDVRETIDAKLTAMEAYPSELRDYPHPRSIEAIRSLAQWRGASAGVPMAEAFILARQIC